MKKLTYRSTLAAGCLGCITQAVVVNLAPLLFLTFQREFSLSLSQIGTLVSCNFCTQLLVDLIATRLGERLSYRVGLVLAHGLALAGLLMMCVLPGLLPGAYMGLVCATVVMAIGGGLLEVLVSPMIDAIPGDAKAGMMSLLHSFYSWGSVAVVLLSTVFFTLLGTAHWRALALFWALLPLANMCLLTQVPMPAQPIDSAGHATPLRECLKRRLFWLLMLMMLCSGAAELAVAQWASLFAESGLGVSKTMGDLLGPCAFAALQGVSRLWFARVSTHHDSRRLLLLCGVGCVAGYMLVVLSPWPLLSLVGFGVCGFAVGPMWPGVLSLGSARYPAGGTAMFALLAFCGDVGCSAGPGLVGAVSDGLQQGGFPLLTALRAGIGGAGIFALLLVAGLWLLGGRDRRKTALPNP